MSTYLAIIQPLIGLMLAPVSEPFILTLVIIIGIIMLVMVLRLLWILRDIFVEFLPAILSMRGKFGKN